MSARASIDLDRLQTDVKTAAGLAGAPYVRETTRAILKAYERFFLRSAVSFRTSTKVQEKRELNVRYVELDAPVDPYPVALAEGFLSKSGHPIDSLLPEIRRELPLLGYGVDFGAAYGLEKIWPFFPHRPQPLERLRALPSLPASVHEHAPYFARHGLDQVSLFAIDYRNRTVNLYFMQKPGSVTSEAVAAMIRELDFQVPSQELLQHCTQAVPLYFTFSWDSPRIERICFGMIAPKPSALPMHLHPLIERYATGAPFASERRCFIYNVALARGSAFFKIENDYTGSMTDLMRVF